MTFEINGHGASVDATVLNSMLSNRICATDSTGSLFGHNAADNKYHFLNISLNDFPQVRLSSRATPTLEINVHGASV